MTSVLSATATSNYYLQSTTAPAVSVAAALSAFKINPYAKLDISDTAANFEKNFVALNRAANNIKNVKVTGDQNSVIQLSASQYLGASKLINKMTPGGESVGFSFSLTDALSKDAVNFNNIGKVSNFSIRDSSTNISKSVTTLMALAGGGKLGTLQLTDPGSSIKVEAGQLLNLNSDPSSVEKNAFWNRLRGGYFFDVSGASTATALQLHDPDILNLSDKVRSVSILDSATNIANNLDELQAMGVQLKAIKSEKADDIFKVDAAQLQRDSAVLGKIYKGYQLAVFNLGASSALSIKSNKKIVSMDIVDTAKNLSKNIALMDRLGSQLKTIQISGEETQLALTGQDFLRYGSVLEKISKPNGDKDTSYKLYISNASVFDAQAIADDKVGKGKQVEGIDVADTSDSISLNLDDLFQNDLVKNIRQTGRTKAISITAEKLQGYIESTHAFNIFNDNYTLNVSGVTVEDLASEESAINLNQNITSLSVAASADEIKDNLAKLTALGKTLTQITQSGPPGSLQLTASQWISNIGMLSKIVGGYGVILEGVSAAKALSIGSDAHVRSLSVSDTAAAISVNLDALQGLAGKLTSIIQTDYEDEAIRMTGKQYAAYSVPTSNPNSRTLLSKLSTGEDKDIKLLVQKAGASQIDALSDNSYVKGIQVEDTVVNIAANLEYLKKAITQKVPITVSMTGTPGAFTLTSDKFLNQYNSIFQNSANVIIGNYGVKITDADVSDIGTLKSNHRVINIGVNATADDLSSVEKLKTLRDLGTKLTYLNQKAPFVPLSMSAANWAVNSALLEKVQGYRVNLSDVKAANAENVLKNEHVRSIDISDSAAQISQNFDKLSNLGTKIGNITKSADDNNHFQLSYQQWHSSAATLNKFVDLDSGSIDILDSSAAQAKFLLGQSAIGWIAIKDSAEGISQNLSDLIDNDQVRSIKLSGPSITIQASVPLLPTTEADSAINKFWDKLPSSISLAVTGAEISDISEILRVSNDQINVVSAEVQGGSVDIGNSLIALSSLGSRLKSLKLTDPSTEDDETTLSLNYSNFKNNRSVLEMIKEPFSLSLENVTASTAAALAQDTQFNIKELSVKDTAVKIASNLDALEGLGDKLTTLDFTDTTSILEISGTNLINHAGVLEKIKTGSEYSINVTQANIEQTNQFLTNDHVQNISVTDFASVISSQFDLLTENNARINSVFLKPGNSELMITGAQYNNAMPIAPVTATFFDKIKSSFTLSVQSATVLDVAKLDSDPHVTNYSLSAKTSDMRFQLPALLAKGKLDQIEVTEADALMTVSYTQLTTIQDDTSKLVGPYQLLVTGVTAENFDEVSARTDVASIGIQFSSEDIATKWDDLKSMGNELDSIAVLGDSSIPVGITLVQWQDPLSAHVISLLPSNQPLELLDVPLDEAIHIAANSADYPNVNGVYVSTLAEQVTNRFDELINLGSFLKAAEITGGGMVELTQAQMDSTTGQKIFGDYDFSPLTELAP